MTSLIAGLLLLRSEIADGNVQLHESIQASPNKNLPMPSSLAHSHF